jgi:ribosomal protein S18 acetylase RimI-like enzyme
MYAIRSAAAADFTTVVDLVVRLQALPEQHIGYHGVTEQEVTDELTGVAGPWADNAVVAVGSHDEIHGVLTADVDRDLGRAWLLGPFVDLPDAHPAADRLWQSAADELLATILTLPCLAGIDDLELYGHRKHRRLADFAAKHGFPSGAMSRVFVLDGSALRTLLVRDAQRPPGVPGVRALPEDPQVRAAVAALHERSFPGRTISGHGLVEGHKEHVIVVAEHGGVIGYAAGYPQDDELYVDYVAVDPAKRSAGVGGALVRGLLREMAIRHGPRGQAAAVISLGNDASERMFTRLGFALHLELVSYRRQAPTKAVG